MEIYEWPFFLERAVIAFNRSLVWIDDRELRRVAFAQAEKLIRRLERIERDLESFESEDQRLYRNWFELTFRIELAQIRESEAELHRLTLFHNWMVAEHHRLDISIAAAYKILKSEEDFYRTANPEERVQIDRERVARDQFLRDMMEKEYEKQRKRQERVQKKEQNANDAANRLFAEADSLSEEAVEDRLSHRASAMDWLVSLLGGARHVAHLLIWRKNWEQVSGPLKGEFKRFMVHAHGVDIERVLNDIESVLADHGAREMRAQKLNRAEPDENNQPAAESSELGFEDGGDSAEDHTDSFSSAAGERAGRAGQAKNRSQGRFESRGERDELIKIIYRKLVRRLHPDMNGANQKDIVAWQKTIWHRVQKAHEDFDLEALERLYRMVLVRSRELSEVTMGEILESHNWLESEIRELNSEVSANRAAPAWGFSRRKNYEALQRKVVKTVLGDLHEIGSELRDMEEQFQMLDAMANGELEMESHGLSRSRSSSQSRRTSSQEPHRKPKSRARRRR